MAGRQAVLVELDRPRRLRYRNAALELLEQHYGAKMATFLESKLEDPGVEDIRVFLWAGLVGEDPTLTEADVRRLIEEGDSEIGEIMGKIEEAMIVAFGEPSKNVTGPVANGRGRKPSK